MVGHGCRVGGFKINDELITIVDEEDRVTGSTTRSTMRARHLDHRSTYILVFNSNGALFTQKRTCHKDVFPGYYDVAAGGVVLADEGYDEGARRELEEELGIRDVPLKRLFKFRFPEGRVWGMAYACVYDGELRLQEEEIESGSFWTIQQILDSQDALSFTPDGMYVLRRCLNDKKLRDVPCIRLYYRQTHTPRRRRPRGIR